MGDLSRNFSSSELECECGCGKVNVSLSFVDALQRVRDVYGKPMVITSGMRCKAHNEAVGGVPGSSHVRGLAADIACTTSKQRSEILPLLWGEFKRIGIDAGFIHVDSDDKKPSPVIWLYYSGNHVA